MSAAAVAAVRWRKSRREVCMVAMRGRRGDPFALTFIIAGLRR